MPALVAPHALLLDGWADEVLLEWDDAGRLTPESLDAALASRGGAPAIVALQAGDLNIGAYYKGTDADGQYWTYLGKDWSKNRLVAFATYAF